MPKLFHVRQDQNHMATTFSFVVSCPEHLVSAASRSLREAHAYVAELENRISEFRTGSPIYQLNQAAPHSRVRLSPEAIELLTRSEHIRAISEGAFDCAAKSSQKNQEIGAARFGWNTVSLEAWRLDPGARIGFGAIGKGYALDAVRKRLDCAGFRDFLLSAGGSSIVLSGFAGPGDPWSWGWSWTQDQSGLRFSHASGQPIALGVSGTHVQGDHLIDPRGTPRSSEASGMLSALVAAPSAADADALSTALFVAGYEQAKRFMAKLPFSPAMAQIGPDKVPTYNGIFRQKWGNMPTQKGFETSLGLAAATIALQSLPQSARADTPGNSDGETALDLGAMEAGTFAPYVTERNFGWTLLPLFAIGVVLLHLKKTRRNLMKKPLSQVNRPVQMLAAAALLWCTLERAQAVDLVPLGKALTDVLGTPKAFKKTIGESTFYYSKDANGKADKVAFIQKNIWQKSCSHTWIVGVGRDGKILSVVAQEQQCPHAKPSAAASFLDQYKDKGPADTDKLKGDVNTIAKATGSCELATDAVVQSITAYQKIKGQL